MKSSIRGVELLESISPVYKALTKMSDQSRLASFFSYPYSSEVSATALAEAGFHYEGSGDTAYCKHCGLKHGGWKKGDNPRSIHLENSPKCSFFETSESECSVYEEIPEELSVGACGGPPDEQVKLKMEEQTCQFPNSSIHTDKVKLHDSKSVRLTAEVPKPRDPLEHLLNVSTEQSLSNDETDPNIPDSLKCSNATTHSPSQSSNNALIQQREQREDTTETQTEESHNQRSREILSVTRHDSTSQTPINSAVESVPPKYRQFAVLSTRLSSFGNWPKSLKQCPEDLAKAGLFYEGTNDYVRCFHCGGGLREWDPEDDPFYEHARWFPFCPFMRLIKGDGFIMSVQSGTLKPPTPQGNDSRKENKASDLEHPAVLSIMELGYNKSLLSKAITIYRQRTGAELSAEKLLPIVWEIEEMDNDDITSDAEFSENDQESESNGTETTSVVTSTHTKGIEELRAENLELREQKRCKVCLDEDASIVFLPCGHLVTCPMCASALRKCPVCRTYIRGTVKAIIS